MISFIRLTSYVLPIIKRCHRLLFVQRDIPTHFESNQSAELGFHIGGWTFIEDIISIRFGPHLVKLDAGVEVQHTVFVHELVADELVNVEASGAAVVAFVVVVVQLRITASLPVSAEGLRVGTAGPQAVTPQPP